MKMEQPYNIVTETPKLVFAVYYRSAEISFPASSTNLKSFEIFEIQPISRKLSLIFDFVICVEKLQENALT